MKIRLTIALIIYCSLHSRGIAQVQLSGKWTYSIASKTSPGNVVKPSEKEIPWVQKDSMLKKGGTVSFTRKFLIPGIFKKQLVNTGIAAVYLGRLIQSDETYFNGVLIGKTGSSDVQRVYAIPSDAINWDKENTILIKLEHWGDKAGAVTSPYLAVAKPQHVFSLHSVANENTRKTSALNKNTKHVAVISSVSEKIWNASVKAAFFNNENSLLHTEEKKLLVKRGINQIKFSYNSPAPFLKIVYTLKIPAHDLMISWNEVAGYDKIVYKAATPIIKYKLPLLFEPADLYNQKMNGWLGERFRINMDKRLKQVDEFALLEGFINKPGKHAWIGEHVGKFLEAACNTYKSTGDAALKIQIDRTAQQLLAAQKKDGYLGTYTTDNEWTSWDVWSHKYNLAGLLSYYELSGYEPALTGAKLIGDLLVAKFGTGEGQRNIIKAGAHVGMAATSVIDPVTDLYIFTGDKKYLDFCYYIIDSYNATDGPAIINTLNATGRVDKTANAKAYEMMSNLVGLVKLYKITADTAQLNPVITAWNDIVEKRLYITGTTSSFEHFQGDHILPAGEKDNMGEGCVTTTWIQLNYQLLMISGKMAYINELERAVYNHLAGAENPQTGCVSYYTPLQGKKPYGCSITCCMSSVPRGIAMIPLFANGEMNDHPAFLFYQEGEYKKLVKDKFNQSQFVSFKTEGNFLKQDEINITVDAAVEADFSVLLRKPYWADQFTLSVNDLPYTFTNADLITIKRSWKRGDKISIRFQLPLITLDGNKSYPGMIALQRGPQVLAFDQSLNKTDALKLNLSPQSLLLKDAELSLPVNWVGNQAFAIVNGANEKKERILLVPYADASQAGGTIFTWIKKTD